MVVAVVALDTIMVVVAVVALDWFLVEEFQLYPMKFTLLMLGQVEQGEQCHIQLKQMEVTVDQAAFIQLLLAGVPEDFVVVYKRVVLGWVVQSRRIQVAVVRGEVVVGAEVVAVAVEMALRAEIKVVLLREQVAQVFPIVSLVQK